MKDLVTFNGYDRRWVPLDDIAPVLVNSVIMSEDGQFCCASRHRSGPSSMASSTTRWPASDARRLDHHHADGEEPLSLAPAAGHGAQSGRTAARRLFRRGAVEEADHGDLSEHRRMGSQHLRHRSGGAAPFRQLGKIADAPAGGAAGRDAAQSDRPQSGQARTRPEAAGLASSRSAPPTPAAMSRCLE